MSDDRPSAEDSVPEEDQAAQDAASQGEVAPTEGEAAPKSGGEAEVPAGMLPLVEPVFGKWAFWICAVPFVIYLVGTSLGTYLENVRKTQPAHAMRGYTKAHAAQLEKELKDLPEADAQAIRERLQPAAVVAAMEDENSDLEGLMQQCSKLMGDDLADLPPAVASKAAVAKSFLGHFFLLEEMIEAGDEAGVLDAHEDFIHQQNLPPEQVPTLRESWYPVAYTITCLASFLAVLIAMPGYLKIPFRISPLAVGVGVVGIFLWIGLWWLDKNFLHLGELLGGSSRAGFNPWKELADTPTWSYVFVGIRLLGLCLVIPIAEEFFARGFLMRYIEDIDWDQIPMGEATWKGLAGIMVYAAMTHPAEIVAALAWFGMITWMYLKTKNVWDCVVAHVVTNALLAVFVLTTNIWELW